MSELLKGKVIAEALKGTIKAEIGKFKFTPVLASIIVGDDPAAVAYVKAQKKAIECCCGIEYRLITVSAEASEQDLIEHIRRLNNDSSVNGIIVQMPLPPDINQHTIAMSIAPEKDVEGIHPVYGGSLVCGSARIIPCTAAAVMALIESTGVDLYGKEAVVVGHSGIVGKPVALLLLDKLATVTVCHIGTAKAGKLAEHVQRADVLVVAVGKANVIKGEWIKQGAIVIDVGINRANGELVGDVEFEKASTRAAFITPVPGGVGPLTTAMLLRNLVEAVKVQKK